LLNLSSDGGLIDDSHTNVATEAARRAGLTASPVFTYLANTLRSGDREIPYSLVTAMDLSAMAPGSSLPVDSASPPIILNEWAARDLAVKIGDPLQLEYYVWEDPGRLVTKSADFQVARIVTISGPAADRDLAPTYPGITESDNLRDWDPPFPLDLRRVRPADEAYWHRYRTTPKAFIPLSVGQALWRSRYGAMTSIRLAPPAGASLDDARDQLTHELEATFDPMASGLAVYDVRSDGLAASRGATSESISRTSAFSWSCPRWSSRRSSSSSASSNESARSGCFERLGSARRRSDLFL
jgi:hypothetical protein